MGKKMRVTESEKDLMVIINNDMKFKDQVASTVKIANKALHGSRLIYSCELGARCAASSNYSFLLVVGFLEGINCFCIDDFLA